MIITNPVWLLLAFPLLALLFFRPLAKRGLTWLRAAIILLILFAMAGTAVRLKSGEGTVMVLADRSLSMPADFSRQQEETCKILNSHRRGGQQLGVIAFAAAPVVEKMPEAPVFCGFNAELDRNQSNLKDAMESALTLVPYNRPGRIIILSDGSWTGADPSGFFAVCASRGIPVDFRQIARSQVHDLAIAAVEAPANVPAGDFYTVGLVIRAPAPLNAEYTITRNNRPYTAGKLQLKQGDNRFYFKDRGNEPQVIRYGFTINEVKSNDPRPENNRAEFLVKINGQRPLLLLTMSPDSGLGKLLRKSGINTRVALPGELGYSLAELSSYSAIIIENVPADLIGNYGLATMAALVKNGTTGLMMTGGKNSFALGGYFKSPLDEILPVSMELRQEHRKLSMAVVVALDRSGSMAAPIGGGKTKIDLADLATVEVMDMLSPQDEFGVFAVDSIAHEVIPLGTAEQAKAARQKILHIQSMGGGIFVFEALRSAAGMLSKAKAGTRHIILFADAADAEQPGEYEALLEKCANAGITVSVIGLGKPTDCDAVFLKDVALRGGGRCFFSENALELPRLFAQDTFVIARNTFIEEQTVVNTNSALRMLRSQGFTGSFRLGGFNLCYLKPQAQTGAITDDEYKAPVVAFWYAGTGRVMTFTGEADGKFTGPFAQWPSAADLLTSMCRWTSGFGESPLPDNMLLTQEMDQGVNRIRLHLDPERKYDPFQKLPEIATLSGQTGRAPVTLRQTMQWETPDSLLLEIPLTGNETSLSTVYIENLQPQVLAPVTLPYSPEFRPADNADYRTSLEQLCHMTGGKERIDLAAVWQELPVIHHWRDIGKWLLLAAVILLLIEVLERRTGLAGRLILRRIYRFRNAEEGTLRPPATPEIKVPHRKKVKTSVKKTKAPEAEPPKATETAQEMEDYGLFSALDQAKRVSKKKK